MAGPVKRSVALAGHRTSLTLEPEFWDAVAGLAAEAGLSVAGLIARIDAQRVETGGLANPSPGGLSSAVRVHVLKTLQDRLKEVPRP